jgi:hypothetical protein
VPGTKYLVSGGVFTRDQSHLLVPGRATTRDKKDLHGHSLVCAFLYFSCCPTHNNSHSLFLFLIFFSMHLISFFLCRGEPSRHGGGAAGLRLGPGRERPRPAPPRPTARLPPTGGHVVRRPARRRGRPEGSCCSVGRGKICFLILFLFYLVVNLSCMMIFVAFVRNWTCNCEIEFMCCDWFVCNCEIELMLVLVRYMSICETICEVPIISCSWETVKCWNRWGMRMGWDGTGIGWGQRKFFYFFGNSFSPGW